MLPRCLLLVAASAAVTVATDPSAPTAAECLAFLRAHMPAADKRSPNITDAFLSEEIKLALAARAAAPWGKTVPKVIFLNDVLPYAILSEPRGLPHWNWRPLFFQHLGAQAAAEPNMSTAAAWVNAASWGLSTPAIKFVGSPNCAINSYAPLQTLERHNSSCTGLAVYVVAALRAVGIPARVAGTPHWNKCGGRGLTCKACPHGDLCTPGDHSSDDACGNHDWAEAWADGGWHFIDPDGSKKLDSGWFADSSVDAGFAHFPERFINGAGNAAKQTEHVGDYYNHSVVASSFAPTSALPAKLCERTAAPSSLSTAHKFQDGMVLQNTRHIIRTASVVQRYPESSAISHFPMVWDWANREVNGWDVTKRYAHHA